MRRSDKKKNMQKANILVEQRRAIRLDEGKVISSMVLMNISRNAAEIVPDAGTALNSLAVSYGEHIPLDKVKNVLLNYDIDFSDVTHKNTTPRKQGGLSMDDLANMGLI